MRRTTGGKSFGLASGNQKEAERRQTRVSLLHRLRRSAHPAQGALACRRSTAVLPKGLTHPLVRLRTRLRGANAMMAGISRRRRLRLQRAPRAPVIVPAGMMSKAARARRRRNLRPRAPHPAPRQPSSPGWRPCTWSERPALLFLAGAESSRIVVVVDLFDPTHFLL